MLKVVFRRALPVLVSVSMAASAYAADPNKIIRDVFPAAETGFDPAASNDLYSGTIGQAIFDTLFSYDYLARPAKLSPLAAETLPQITDNGKTYTIKLRKGIMFAPDPAFGGKKRELVAEDVVYSLKRLADPKLRSPWVFLVEGKFVGLDEEIAAAKQGGKFDYDKKLPGPGGEWTSTRFGCGSRTPTTTFPTFSLTSRPRLSRAKVIEKYGESDGRAMANPVGSGPYRLAQWVRGSKIVLEANPNTADSPGTSRRRIRPTRR
jgi:ABC-type transport system substrate-binding protein